MIERHVVVAASLWQMELHEQPDEVSSTSIDLDAIETDLADVEIALARLDAGTYWTCEITGAPLPDELLIAHPTARRNVTN
jgi:RNA polymerase-binding transcription factor DksA